MENDGCEVSCANDYIKNVKGPEKYRAIGTEYEYF